MGARNGKLAGKSGGYNSITALMKETLEKDGKTGYTTAEARVRKFFPGSKFNKRHFSWYICAFRRGQLKGVRQ